MQKIKLTKKNYVCLSVYAVCILEIALILPFQFINFGRLFKKVQGLKKKVVQAKESMASKDEMAREKEKTRLDILNLKGKIITSGDISAVLAYISRKAKENSVDVLEITQGRPRAYKTIDKTKFFHLPVRIKAQAAFHNLNKFFNSLEEGYYFLEPGILAIKENISYNTVDITLVLLFKE